MLRMSIFRKNIDSLKRVDCPKNIDTTNLLKNYLGHLLITKTEVESNDVLIVQMSQMAISHQLVALSSSLGLMPGEKVLSLESPSSSFIINGILLPLYLGCDLFLLPAQVTKQSPEVWPRIGMFSIFY